MSTENGDLLELTNKQNDEVLSNEENENMISPPKTNPTEIITTTETTTATESTIPTEIKISTQTTTAMETANPTEITITTQTTTAAETTIPLDTTIPSQAIIPMEKSDLKICCKETSIPIETIISESNVDMKTAIPVESIANMNTSETNTTAESNTNMMEITNAGKSVASTTDVKCNGNMNFETIIAKLEEEDVCDCPNIGCPGCFFPCEKCSSNKCASVCRINRGWKYESWIYEGDKTYSSEGESGNEELKN